MSKRRKAPGDPVTATEASAATRCARQYYLEYVALVPVDVAAERRRRAGTERHIAYTRDHFGIGAPRVHTKLRLVGAFILVLLGLTLGLVALRIIGWLP